MVVHAEPELASRLEGADRGAENAIVLMNHHTELDWLYSWMVSSGRDGWQTTGDGHLNIWTVNFPVPRGPTGWGCSATARCLPRTASNSLPS